jgi:hypothetical protein
VAHPLLQGAYVRLAARGDCGAERVAQVVEADRADAGRFQVALEALEHLGAVQRVARVRVHEREVVVALLARSADPQLEKVRTSAMGLVRRGCDGTTTQGMENHASTLDWIAAVGTFLPLVPRSTSARSESASGGPNCRSTSNLGPPIPGEFVASLTPGEESSSAYLHLRACNKRGRVAAEDVEVIVTGAPETKLEDPQLLRTEGLRSSSRTQSQPRRECTSRQGRCGG